MPAVTDGSMVEIAAARPGPERARLDALARLFAAGDYAGAEAAARALIAAFPSHGAGWKAYAASLGMAGRLDEALAAARRAADLAPRDGEARRNLAALQLRAGDRAGAAESLGAAVRIRPADAVSHRQLGAVLRDLGRLADAEASYRIAARLAPGDAESQHGLGVVLQLQRRPEEAAAFFRAAIALAPDRPGPRVNLAASLKDLGAYDDALAQADQALATEPGNARAHGVRAVVLQQLGRSAEALAGFDRALALDPGHEETRWNRAVVLLASGRLAEGWPAYEARWYARTRRATSRPLWLGGQDVAGRRILLWREQGFGDQIQFVRYAEQVAARGAQVLLEVDRPLLRLMDGLAGPRAIAASDTPFADQDFDLHCPLMSLPLALGTQMADIPARVPYLRVPADAQAAWARALGAARRPRIGIAWSGHTGHADDRQRSLALARLAPLLDARADWISLQRDMRAADQATLQALPALRHFGTRLADFADTAALCAQCDLVIAVDTSVAHLAGALGRPVWILLPFAADWRWLTARADSPWYPTARLLRQPRPGDWDGVFEQLARALGAWLDGRALAAPLVRLYAAGDLAGAERGVDALLAAHPSSPDGLKLRGALLARRGAFAAARAAMRAAVDAAPGDAEAWRHLAGVATRLGQAEEAETAYRRAIDLEPGHAAAQAALARILHAAGKLAEAARHYDEAVRLAPDAADTRNDHAVVLAALDRLDEAEATLGAAIALRPDHAQAHRNLAALLRRRGRLDEAIAAQARAMALSPDDAAACIAHADLLCLAARHAEGLASYDRALRMQPDNPATHANRGLALQHLGRHDEALAAFGDAIALQPDFAAAHTNRGLLLRMLGRADEARASLAAALDLDPAAASAHVNLALALRDLGRMDEALAVCEGAIALAPGASLPRWNKALMLLAQGRWREAWPLYEWRWRGAQTLPGEVAHAHDDGFTLIWQTAKADPQRRTARPAWRGEGPLAGRRILLWREQGFGDQIQFVRYAEQVAALGAQVLLEVDRPLLRLMDGLAGARAIAASDTPFADTEFDLHCPLMSLPLALGAEMADIPARLPYLRVPADAQAAWARALGAARRPRIGIAWSGHPAHSEDRQRSLALARLAPLLDARADWISLQRDMRAADQATLQALPALRHFGTRLADFADTAALCTLCDLVIAVDTSVAHLAGALGRPVWILLPFAADWRWLRQRADSPWYPTARLLRQAQPGDWDSVFADLARALDAWFAGADRGASGTVKPDAPAC